MTTIEGFILMCSGTVAIASFVIVLGANFERLIAAALGDGD